MKFLLDTNVLIPVEPASRADLDPQTLAIAEFLRLAQESGQQIYRHPLIRQDLANDTNADRRAVREKLFPKYGLLPDPPTIGQIQQAAIGISTPGTNDWVDDHLLAAVLANAVNKVVTEDNGIHRKAARLHIPDRVLRVADAVLLLRNLFDKLPAPPPAILALKAHSLDVADPIFASLHQDYPDFDQWLEKCQTEHRQAWVARIGTEKRYAGVCIVNREEKDDVGLAGRVLKTCLFKTSDEFHGYRLGELLLKTVFEFAKKNGYDSTFMTVFPKHERLRELLLDFGFVEQGSNPRGEVVCVKRLTCTEQERASGSPWDFHIRFGPLAARMEGASCYVIPIQPRFHQMLFPEWDSDAELLPGMYAYGNSIRKAYLCRSKIQSISKGDVLCFYRSKDVRGVTILGVVEETLRSTNAEAIASFVGKRTVYRYKEIAELAAKEVLSILFRQVRLLTPSIRLEELQANGVLSGAPQSITECKETGKQWLAARLGL